MKHINNRQLGARKKTHQTQKAQHTSTESSTHTSTAHMSPTATRGWGYHGSLVVPH